MSDPNSPPPPADNPWGKSPPRDADAAPTKPEAERGVSRLQRPPSDAYAPRTPPRSPRPPRSGDAARPPREGGSAYGARGPGARGPGASGDRGPRDRGPADRGPGDRGPSERAGGYAPRGPAPRGYAPRSDMPGPAREEHRDRPAAGRDAGAPGDQPRHDRTSHDRGVHDRGMHERGMHDRAPHGQARGDRGPSPWRSGGESPRAPRGDAPAPYARFQSPPPARPARPVAPEVDYDFDEDSGTVAPATRERRELRLYGLNAIDAVFRARPEAIRKVYLVSNRIPALQPLLKWCVEHRVGYRVVSDDDLQRLAASGHHEGVVADVLRLEPQPLGEWLRDLPTGPQCAIWLDGVGNPHNLGAILRSAAHFGVAAVLLPKHSPLALSGAAARVAEGGAEAMPMVRLGRSDNALVQLRSAGFTLAATVVDGGRDVFAAPMPERVVFVIGAEGEGMDRDLAQACDLQLSIPGTGAVESLNVAAATAVLLAAWRSRR